MWDLSDTLRRAAGVDPSISLNGAGWVTCALYMA